MDAPASLSSDSACNSDTFVADRQPNNAQMMRRCKSLCTARTRRDIEEYPGGFVPSGTKAQARRNLQKLLPFMPLDSDLFTFGTWLSWVESKNPFRNKLGENKTRLPDMIRAIATQIADVGSRKWNVVLPLPTKIFPQVVPQVP